MVWRVVVKMRCQLSSLTGWSGCERARYILHMHSRGFSVSCLPAASVRLVMLPKLQVINPNADGEDFQPPKKGGAVTSTKIFRVCHKRGSYAVWQRLCLQVGGCASIVVLL